MCSEGEEGRKYSRNFCQAGGGGGGGGNDCSLLKLEVRGGKEKGKRSVGEKKNIPCRLLSAVLPYSSRRGGSVCSPPPSTLPLDHLAFPPPPTLSPSIEEKIAAPLPL